MAKRVAIVLAGCGGGDGTEVGEAVLAMAAVERAGGVALFAAPHVPQPYVVDHATGARVEGVRQVAVEAARIARGPVRDLAGLPVEDIDALVVPGGAGVGAVLSNYDDRGVVCDVNADLARLLKACLASRRPIGLVSLAPVLAARVLGPIAGVRVTLGARASAASKHAAVMGADVRPCPARDILIDQKHRLVSTPGHLHDDASTLDVAIAIEKLVRTVLSFARDRSPRPPQPGPDATPGRGSGESGRAPSGTRPPRSPSPPRGS